MRFDYDLLIEDALGWEEFWNINKPTFKGLESGLKETYKVKYIDLLFELYHRGYELSNINTDEFNEDDKEDIDNLVKDVKLFIVAYSRVLQFFDFAEVECPYHIWSYFDKWKNRGIELIESLE